MRELNPFSSGNNTAPTARKPKAKAAPKAAAAAPRQPKASGAPALPRQPKAAAPKAAPAQPRQPEPAAEPEAAPKPTLSWAEVEEAKQERANTSALTTNAEGVLGKVGADGVFRPAGWNKKKKRVRKTFTDNDFLVLALAAHAGVITKRMAYQVLPVNEHTAYKRLRGLARAGMLEAVQVPPTQVYVLKRKALSFLNSYGFEEHNATLLTEAQVFGGRETKHILGRGQWLASVVAATPEDERIGFLAGGGGGEGLFFLSETPIKADALAAWGRDAGAVERVAAVRGAQHEWRASGHSEEYLMENLRTFQYCQSADRLGRPDGVIVSPEGHHAAIEIETARKSTPEYDRILGFFAAENSSPFAGVVYVVSEEKIERAIKRSKFYERLAAENVLRIERLHNAYGEPVRNTRDIWKL